MDTHSDGSTVTAISQAEALELDRILMGDETGYSLNQLMELAGLSASIAIQHFLDSRFPPGPRSVLVCCGPGNNGGDGLVVARHLAEFGHKATVLCPRLRSGDLYQRLFALLASYDVATSSDTNLEFKDYCVIIDAIFGISFNPPVREPFDSLLKDLIKTHKPIISLDIPSGWDVDSGPLSDEALRPVALLSLAVPKRCSAKFRGPHYLCGRFVPRRLADRFALKLPRFAASSQILDISQFAVV